MHTYSVAADAHLDTLSGAVHNTVLSLQVTVTEAIVMHEDDGMDELLEVVGYHWLWQLLFVRCIQQVQ